MFATGGGLLFACGDNGFLGEGQLGVGDTENFKLVPTLVTGLQGKQVVHVAAGRYYTLSITADGSLFSWGANGSGQSGVGDTESRRVPTLITGLGGKQQV